MEGGGRERVAETRASPVPVESFNCESQTVTKKNQKTSLLIRNTYTDLLVQSVTATAEVQGCTGPATHESTAGYSRTPRRAIVKRIKGTDRLLTLEDRASESLCRGLM